MTTLSTATRTARKPHQCSACLGDILPGEKYQVVGIVRDGFYRWRQHLCCAEAESYYAQENPNDYPGGEGFPQGWIAEAIERGEEFTPDLLARLTVASQAVAPDLAAYARTMERIAEWEAESVARQLAQQDHIGNMYAIAARRAVKCPRLCAAAAERAVLLLKTPAKRREIVQVGLASVGTEIARLGRRGCDSDAAKLEPLRERMVGLCAMLAPLLGSE